MKFYKYKNKNKYSSSLISFNKLTAIYCDDYSFVFFKDGLRHNYKNAAYVNCINNNVYKEFILHYKYYGNQSDFTKQSWRRFVKLQTFL